MAQETLHNYKFDDAALPLDESEHAKAYYRKANIRTSSLISNFREAASFTNEQISPNELVSLPNT